MSTPEVSMIQSLKNQRRRLYEIVEIGEAGDNVSRAYDIFYTVLIIVNLAACIAYTFNDIEARCGTLLNIIEDVTVFFFAVDYALRVFTSVCRFPERSTAGAVAGYVFSFMGIVDLLSFLPNYLPFFFPSGAVAFRMFRVIRIFRLFRINKYYDSLNVITEVIKSKSEQLISSVFIIFILIISSSMCMYSIENTAQPDVFENAFSGIWWAVSTLLTIGYGDIYPVTPLGQAISIVITILGVGMVAIPTGIISAGFVDQYSRIKKMNEYGREEAVHFIKVPVSETDRYSGRSIRELGMPSSIIIAAVLRDGKTIVPNGDVILQPGDTLVIGAESAGSGDISLELKEVYLAPHNPWVNQKIRDLDISRQTIIVLIHRGGESIIPNGGTVLLEGDRVILFSQSHISTLM